MLALALAIRCRGSFADGAWRIDLAALPPGADTTLVRTTLANALRLADAAARDAAKRDEAGPQDQALTGDGFVFATRGVSDEERAAPRVQF